MDESKSLAGGYQKSDELARKYMKASAAQGDHRAVAHLSKMNACALCGADAAPRGCWACMGM